MHVTDVKIRRLSNEGKMRAVVSVTFDEAFVVHDIKIIEGINGLFVAMPSRRVGHQDYRDIAHPINAEARERITKQIFEAYHQALGEVPVEDPFLA